MPDNKTKKRQLIARHDDDLARIRKAERKYDARRKYLLGNLVVILGKRKPKTAAWIILEATKLASGSHDKLELAQLARGQTTQSRIILLGALLLNYAGRAPLDRRVFDILRSLARPADRDMLADVFEHHERYRPVSDVLDNREEAAARAAEKAERRRDAVRLVAMRMAARDGIPLSNDDDDDGDDDPTAELAGEELRGERESAR